MDYPARLLIVPALVPALVALAATGASTPAHAQSDAFSELSLRQAVDRALAKNPLVVASVLEIRRAEGAARGLAGVLADNPLFTSEAGYRRDRGLGDGLRGSFAGRLEQPLDLLGQAGARKQAGADLVALARARLDLARAEIVARTQLLYVAAQVARARIALCQERIEAARKTAEALELRVRLGASSDIDLRMAQAEVGRAESALHDAQAQVVQDQWALRELLDLPASAAAHVTDVLSPPAPPAQPSDADEQAMLARHTAVRAVEKRQLAIDSEIVRLERERLPRLSLGVAAERPSSQERFIGLAFSVSPALWRRNQGPIAEARVERERAEVERATTLAGLARRLSAVREEYDRRREELAAVERTLAHEEEVRTLVRAGWQAGKFDFLRVLLAERSVADTKEARLALWALLWNDVIDLERLLSKGPWEGPSGGP